MRWSAADLEAYEQRRRALNAMPRLPPLAATPTKYRAVRTEGPDGCGGTRVYRSKLEARLAQRLEAERQFGGLAAFVPEVSIPIGATGGKPVRHTIDQLAILEVRPDGSFVGRFIEAKGFDAEKGKRKRAAVTRLYGLAVEVVG